MAGAAHLSNDNAGVLRRAQRERKSHVEQKGKSSQVAVAPTVDSVVGPENWQRLQLSIFEFMCM